LREKLREHGVLPPGAEGNGTTAVEDAEEEELSEEEEEEVEA
jgi:hypothetical protein